MELPSDATPADKMAHYARTIPEALSEMDEKQGATQQVIQWCESEYRTGDKRRVMTMTREYLTDALVSITTDVGGFLTGLLGVGIGETVLPQLVRGCCMPVPLAAGTSVAVAPSVYAWDAPLLRPRK